MEASLSPIPTAPDERSTSTSEGFRINPETGEEGGSALTEPQRVVVVREHAPSQKGISHRHAEAPGQVVVAGPREREMLPSRHRS